MRETEHYACGLVITETANDLSQILLPDIRGVIWRRKPEPGVIEAAESFSTRRLSDIYNNSGSDPEKLQRRGFDPKQIMIERHAQRRFPELSLIWEDRLKVKKTLERQLHAPFHLNQLQVQPAQRRTVDHIAHQDRACGEGSGVPKNCRVIATIAHSNNGTIFVPKEIAGRSTPDVHRGRRFYHHSKDLRDSFQAQSHDVFLTKTGAFEAGIHKAPYVRGGLRLFSFMISKHSYLDIREQFDITP